MTESSTTYIGRVRWFDRKKGFGFVSITDGDKAGTDIFVHHSEVQVAQKQYRYLVEGEYVEFAIDTRETGDKTQDVATHVTGVKGGKLLCETQYEAYVKRREFNESRPKTQQRSVRGRGGRGRGRVQQSTDASTSTPATTE